MKKKLRYPLFGDFQKGIYSFLWPKTVNIHR